MDDDTPLLHLGSQPIAILVVLEVLHRTLVCLRCFLAAERAKVAAAAGFGIFFTRVQAVLTGF